MQEDSENWISTSEAAEVLGVTRPTLIRILDKGVIRYRRPGRTRQIYRPDVEAYRAQTTYGKGNS